MKKKILGIGSILAGTAILGTTKRSHLTGDVIRYHNSANRNIPSILKEGIKAKYSEDPENLTNKHILKDTPMSKKRGLVYLAKNKELATSVGAYRSAGEGKLFPKKPSSEWFDPEFKALREENLRPKHSKTLTVHLKYGDLKKMPRENNPELKGYHTPEKIVKDGFRKIKDLKKAKKLIKSLNEDTHTYRGDIGPEHIEESPKYKRNSVSEHIKEYPGHVIKELGKITAGSSLIGYGLKKLIKK